MRQSLLVAVAVLAAACKQPEPPSRAASGAPPIAPAPAQPGASVQGKVLERIDADVYSYLKLSMPSGEAWAAVPKTDVAAGTEVTVVNPMTMNGFESKTLKRKFDRIYFGTLAGQLGPAADGPAPAGPPGAAPAASGMAEMAARHAEAAAGPADAGVIRVEKAKGADARTVAELFSQKGVLKGKSVAVRGKVVKFTPGVMGRNWIHLRDGTGRQGANDLTVTTGDAAAVGDLVVARGKVATDRDFGAGYTYSVMLEEAKIAK